MPGARKAPQARNSLRAQRPGHVRCAPVTRSGSRGGGDGAEREGLRGARGAERLAQPLRPERPLRYCAEGRAPAGARRERGFAPPRSGGTAQARQRRAGDGRVARHRAATATAANIAKRGYCTRERGLRQRGRRAGLCVSAARIVRGAAHCPRDGHAPCICRRSVT